MDRKKKTLREMTPAEIDEYIASRKAWRDLSEVERGERTEQDRARNYRAGFKTRCRVSTLLCPEVPVCFP
jgi:hypothetical protein